MDLNNLLRSVVDAGASDVHLKVGRPPIVRRDGELEPLQGWPVLDQPELEEVLALVGASSRSRLAAFDETGELDTAYQADGLPRFRVNVFRQRGEVSFAFRVIPSEIPDFESLGLPARRPEAVRGAPRADPRHRRHRRRQDDDARRDARRTSTGRAGSTSSRSRIRSSSSTTTSAAS